MENMEIVNITPDCIVMRCLLTGETITLWHDPKVIDLAAKREARHGAR